jgi:hypothetical protein
MKRLILIAGLLLGGCSDTAADKFSLKDCWEVANHINENMSNFKLDEQTILKHAICTLPVKLNYIYELTIDAADAKLDFQPLRSKLLNTWCTSPDMRILLDAATSIVYTYNDINGKYVGKIEISDSECRI